MMAVTFGFDADLTGFMSILKAADHNGNLCSCQNEMGPQMA